MRSVATITNIQLRYKSVRQWFINAKSTTCDLKHMHVCTSHEVVGAGIRSTLSIDTHARTAPAILYLVYTNRFPDMLADNTHYPWVLTAGLV